MRNQPIGPAIDFSADVVYVLIPTTEYPTVPNNIRGMVAKLLDLWISLSLDWQLQLINMERKITVAISEPYPEDFIVIRPERDLEEQLGVGLLSFGKNVKDLIQLGEDDALRGKSQFYQC